jgi:two-component system, OmpR family, alkaline phosphatase synthesis response regulator PhoP
MNPPTRPTKPAAAPRPAPDAPPVIAPEADLADSSILIVDDNAQNLELLHAYLEELGCTVRTAADGLEALASIEADQPDLVLLDVMMPRMSGFQACAKIKSNPATRDIPIIMVTALNEVGDVERAVESGADDFLTKPVNKLELLTRVKSLLRVRLLKRQLDKTLAQMRRLRGE